MMKVQVVREVAGETVAEQVVGTREAAHAGATAKDDRPGRSA